MLDIESGDATDARKGRYRDAYDRLAGSRDDWIDRNRAFYDDDFRFMRFLVPEGARILELGCGTGRLLAELRPSTGVGIDLSPHMVEIARRNHPELQFICGDFEDPSVLDQLAGPFDFIVLSDSIGFVDDCQLALQRLHRLCHPGTRLVLAYFNQLWRPLLRFAEIIGHKMREPSQSWLSLADLQQLLNLADFEFVRAEHRQIVPKHLFGVGRLLNDFLGPLPLIRLAALRYYIVARPRGRQDREPTCSVVVPCRNERGNI